MALSDVHHDRLERVATVAGFPFAKLCQNFDRWAERDGDDVALDLLATKEAEYNLI